MLGLVEKVLCEIVAHNHSCITAKEILDVYPGRSFYIKVANFGKDDLHISKDQNVDEVTDVPVKIVHVKYKCSLYLSCAHAISVTA